MELFNENMIHKEINNVGILQFKKLLEYDEIVHAFSLKPLNFSNKEGIVQNYRELLCELNLDYETLVKPNQGHTDNIIILKNKVNKETADINLDYLKNVDAIITNQRNITLATTNADCLNLLLYDPEKHVIANVHSGWRGTFQKIAKKVVMKMIEIYECNPKNILVFLAPAIRKCHFWVDEDLMLECKNIFSYTDKINEIITVGNIIDGFQKYNIDNILINKLLLKEAGILDKNIIDSEICSFCNNDKIHSRRADGDSFGLNTVVISMI